MALRKMSDPIALIKFLFQTDPLPDIGVQAHVLSELDLVHERGGDHQRPRRHYDLGAGGRSVTTDCHDANAAPGGINAAPQCWTGTTIVAVSTGLQWKF